MRTCRSPQSPRLRFKSLRLALLSLRNNHRMWTVTCFLSLECQTVLKRATHWSFGKTLPSRKTRLLCAGQHPKALSSAVTPSFGICTSVSPLPQKHEFPIYSRKSGSVMLRRFLQLLNTLCSILFNVCGSRTSSTALPWKTPDCGFLSSTPRISSPSLNLTVLRLLHSANAPCEMVRSEAGNSTNSSALLAKQCYPTNSSPSGKAVLLRLLQP